MITRIPATPMGIKTSVLLSILPNKAFSANAVFLLVFFISFYKKTTT